MAKKYQPSSGTEGDFFISKFCEQCIHERWMHFQEEDREKDKCNILSRSFVYDIKDPEYPSEWTYNEEGSPCCTAWQKWDWGNDGDPNDPDNPKSPPPPVDPNQLDMFPLYPDETTFEKTIKQVEVNGEG